MEIVELVRGIITAVVMIAWLMFFLTWAIGWLVKSLPIPFIGVKKWGNRFVEDAIWGAFWLAMGTTVFALIAYIVGLIQQPMPPPPSL